jgi:hypothetical protein
MKNTFWMLLLAVFTLPACGGTEGTTTNGQTYAQDLYGTTYQPELITPQYDQAMNVNNAIKVALGLSDNQMTACLSGIVHVVEQQVDACPPEAGGVCNPEMRVCLNDGTCVNGVPNADALTVTSATLTVVELKSGSCYFDIEYGMALGYLLDICKRGGSVQTTTGNFPDAQAVNETLRGMNLCVK